MGNTKIGRPISRHPPVYTREEFEEIVLTAITDGKLSQEEQADELRWDIKPYRAQLREYGILEDVKALCDYERGKLTQGEFETKAWDILVRQRIPYLQDRANLVGMSRQNYRKRLRASGIYDIETGIEEVNAREIVVEHMADRSLSIPEVIEACGYSIPKGKTPREILYKLSLKRGCLDKYKERRSLKAEKRQGREALIRVLHNPLVRLVSNLQNSVSHKDPAIDSYGGLCED